MSQKTDQHKYPAQTRIGWLLTVCLLIVVVSFVQANRKDVNGLNIQGTDDPSDRTTTLTAVQHDQNPEELLPVYLVGAIRNPGIYNIEQGTCLYEIIDDAGGLTDEAADDAINLAQAVQSNQFIRIPTRDEVDAGFFSAPSGPSGETARGLIDINRASQQELETLPGVGPVTARTIVAHREEHGAFSQIEDLMQVPGIKDARFEALKDMICVTGSS